jgi:peptide/nickel transport system ATP-binding protein
MRAIRGGRISIIFQEPMTSLSPLHTVGDQVVETVRLHRDVSKVEARELAHEMLDMVGFPDPRRALDTYPFELSGGLRQRAMISMALVCRPALLIADEPTTALDVTIQAQILKLVKDLQGQLGMTVLLITHDLGVVANMAEDVIVIYHGNVMERGSLDDIFSDPQHPYLKALMLAVPRMGMTDGERLTPIRDSTHATGGYLAERVAWPADADDNGPLLRVQRVSKCFGMRKGSFLGVKDAHIVQALDDVSFDIERGECLGLVGESGCGKTTLSKIIMRAIDPDAGEVHYNDRGVQRSLLALNDKDSLVIHGIGDRAQRTEIVKELMQHVGLDPRFLSRYPHSFSGGQRQRIGIARALALNPDLLICDEPVSALDVSVQAQILNLLKDLQSELGLTYLFISHNLAVVDYMADRIAVMCAGHLVEIAPRETLFDNPIHPYTKALLTAVPRTDPSQRLDFSALMEGRVSDPRAWPDPFGANGAERPDFLDLGGAHFVRARRSLLAQAKA